MESGPGTGTLVYSVMNYSMESGTGMGTFLNYSIESGTGTGTLPCAGAGNPS